MISYDSDPSPFRLDGSTNGVLLLHGFTSTPQSVSYVGHMLHQQSGATLSVPLLAGHGTTLEAFAATKNQDWLASAEAEMRWLATRCERITVAGLSLGGTIALNLAIRYPEIVDHVVSINGSTGIYSPDQASQILNDGTIGFHEGIGSDINREDMFEICYDRIPASTMRERYLLTTATGLMLPSLRQRILVIQSREDHVVNPQNAHRIAQEVASHEVRLVWLPSSYHVATLDYDRDTIVSAMTEFIAVDTAISGT